MNLNIMKIFIKIPNENENLIKYATESWAYDNIKFK